MKLVSLDYIVKNAMIQIDGSVNMRHYQTYLQYAIRGHRELRLFATTSVKVAFCEMLPNKAINLPPDFVKYTKIGLCINGRILTLGLDNSLCVGNSFSECGDPLPVAIDNLQNTDAVELGIIAWPFLDQFRNGQYVGGLYGVGGGFNSKGYYKEDYAHNRIQFSSEVPSETIVLEYISDGSSPDGTASVPVQAVEPLIAFVHWKRLEFDRKANQYDKSEAERKYIVQFRKMKHFDTMFTVKEYLDSQAVNVHQAPKR